MRRGRGTGPPAAWIRVAENTRNGPAMEPARFIVRAKKYRHDVRHAGIGWCDLSVRLR